MTTSQLTTSYEYTPSTLVNPVAAILHFMNCVNHRNCICRNSNLIELIEFVIEASGQASLVGLGVLAALSVLAMFATLGVLAVFATLRVFAVLLGLVHLVFAIGLDKFDLLAIDGDGLELLGSLVLVGLVLKALRVLAVLTMFAVLAALGVLSVFAVFPVLVGLTSLDVLPVTSAGDEIISELFTGH